MRAPLPTPRRGDVWLADLDPVRGHEQAGRRPILVLSEDTLNAGRRRLVIAVPLSTRLYPIPLHVRVVPPEGGIDRVSDILPEQIRSLSTERLTRQLGRVSQQTLHRVGQRLRALLELTEGSDS